MELAFDFQDVTTMRLLEREDGEEEAPKLTPEDHARHERIMKMARERIAWREAKQRELGAAREREQRK